jgi:hypothetical protein
MLPAYPAGCRGETSRHAPHATARGGAVRARGSGGRRLRWRRLEASARALSLVWRRRWRGLPQRAPTCRSPRAQAQQARGREPANSRRTEPASSRHTEPARGRRTEPASRRGPGAARRGPRRSKEPLGDPSRRPARPRAGRYLRAAAAGSADEASLNTFTASKFTIRE